MAERNFVNRTLYHGENLEFLRGMNSGTVDLIATDPPFNKSRDFHATPDSLSSGARFEDRWSWARDVHEPWLAAISDTWPSVYKVIMTTKECAGEDMGAFLAWLGARLLEMRRVLADDGSLYLHIDHTAHAYVKTLMDAIFGRKNFRNEIVWCYSGGGVPRRDFPRKHDTLLRYTKSDNYRFHVERKPYKENTQEVGIHSTYGGHNPIDLARGTPITDWWTDIPTTTGWSPENTGYPTQKPLALYERIIETSSNPGDFVLDPFCGCATTPIAAERLGRQWVGMDIWAGAHKVVLDRLKAEDLAVRSRRGRRDGQQRLTFSDIAYSEKPPRRTDDGRTAAEPLPLVLRAPRAQASNMTRDEKIAIVAKRTAGVLTCDGCGFKPPRNDQRYLELDHIKPRSQGGKDEASNWTLLCGPCNKEKRDKLSIVELRDRNVANGWIVKSR